MKAAEHLRAILDYLSDLVGEALVFFWRALGITLGILSALRIMGIINGVN